MKMEEYQRAALKTAIYPKEASVSYPTLGLSSEVGEVSGLVKKQIRDGTDMIELREKLVHELGDVLWYVAVLAADLDISLSVIAEENVKKLKDRQERGVIQGSGDNR